MNFTESEFELIIEKITQKTGIVPLESHKEGIRNYLLKQEHFDISSSQDFAELINESTVNETYFFREEKHFKLLEKKLFPEWIRSNGNKAARIWSAACSSGEEIFSLLLLARKAGIAAEFTASDINTRRLTNISNGIYRPRSVRSIDGAVYHPLLEPFRQTDGSIHFPEEICAQIKTCCINLLESAFPENQNFLFLRNVLLYFKKDVKQQILKTIAETSLAPGGYLFVSINEIPGIDKEIMPACLEKVFVDGVYCFHKKEELQ